MNAFCGAIIRFCLVFKSLKATNNTTQTKRAPVSANIRWSCLRQWSKNKHSLAHLKHLKVDNKTHLQVVKKKQKNNFLAHKLI